MWPRPALARPGRTSIPTEGACQMLDRSVADPAPFGAKAASGLSVLLTDGFSMLSLSAITEALSLASRQAGHTGEKVRLVGFPSRWPLARSGVQVVVDHAIDRAGAADGLVDWHDGLFLHRRGPDGRAGPDGAAAGPQCPAPRKADLRDRGGGACACAKQLVTGCTDHWTRVASLRETVSSASVQESIFVRDGHVITSPGETAAPRPRLRADPPNGWGRMWPARYRPSFWWNPCATATGRNRASRPTATAASRASWAWRSTCWNR